MNHKKFYYEDMNKGTQGKRDIIDNTSGVSTNPKDERNRAIKLLAEIKKARKGKKFKLVPCGLRAFKEIEITDE